MLTRFYPVKMKERDHSGELDVNGKVILRFWTEFVWLRTRTTGGLFFIMVKDFLSSVKNYEFLNSLSFCDILKRDSAPSNYLDFIRVQETLPFSTTC
jgi:hypothetical protein